MSKTHLNWEAPLLLDSQLADAACGRAQTGIQAFC